MIWTEFQASIIYLKSIGFNVEPGNVDEGTIYLQLEQSVVEIHISRAKALAGWIEATAQIVHNQMSD